MVGSNMPVLLGRPGRSGRARALMVKASRSRITSMCCVMRALSLTFGQLLTQGQERCGRYEGGVIPHPLVCVHRSRLQLHTSGWMAGLTMT